MGQCKKYGWKIKKGSKATWLRWGGKQKVEQEVESETGEAEIRETFISRFKWLQVFNTISTDSSRLTFTTSLQPMNKVKLTTPTSFTLPAKVLKELKNSLAATSASKI